jgi:threonyl-tRNA synthetase
VQLYFNLPERFQLEFTGADNATHRPVMLHRVLVGSMERFVGGLIEHYAGAFPLWLAPEQIRVVPIAEEVTGYAQTIVDELRVLKIRAELDARSETLNYRIREAEIMKVPYMAVVGRREAEGQTVALRARGMGKKQEVIGLSDLVDRLKLEIETRAVGGVVTSD